MSMQEQFPVRHLSTLAATDLTPSAPLQVPSGTRDLIDHIVERYHEVHRRELPALIDLAREVETSPPGHAALPAELSRLLQTMRLELEMHMCKEEHIVFALIKEGEGPLIASTIEMMMLDHEAHHDMLRQLESLTAGCAPSDDADPTRHALYSGLRKLIDDLIAHIDLENNVLFPRFLNRADVRDG